MSLFCRVDLFFGHFPFKEVLCGPIVYMSPQSGLMASVSVLSIFFYNHWSRSLGLAQGRISSLLVNLVSVVSRKVRFLWNVVLCGAFSSRQKRTSAFGRFHGLFQGDPYTAGRQMPLHLLISVKTNRTPNETSRAHVQTYNWRVEKERRNVPNVN